ncbi:cupin domain-containing protein [Rapidithrix thailandica]|uniref:Cupin domain-containing protein n=1 Tax=Rapidithrix thailandica TaxID=413964 RepID=A0AAW9SD11_9BACT
MNSNIENYILRSQQQDWSPLQEEGINTQGIFVKALRFDEQTQRPPSILLKFEPGAQYPYHNHPAGEELFVLEGEAIIEGAKLTGGDYLYTPPQFKHSVATEKGCVLLLIVPEEVEILEK